MRTSTSTTRFQSLKDLKAPPIPIMSLLALHSAFLQKNLVLFIFTIHQIQLFAIILRTSFMTLETTSSSFQWICERINQVFFLKDQASFDESSANIISTMTLITLYFLLVIVTLAYILLVTCKKARLFIVPLRTWHLITLLHPYAVFFPIHVMLVQATTNIFNNPLSLSDNKGLIVFIKIYWIFLIICNFVLSAFIRQFLSINLHTHDPLCIKTRVINLFDLIYQTLLPILLIVPDPSQKLGDALIAINLICFLARDWTLYYYLPYYKFSALNIANIAQGIFTSTSFITIFGKLILQGRDLQHPVGFILMICSLSNTFFVRVYLSRLQNIYRKILIHPQKLTNPFHLIHHLQVYKFFSRNASINFNTSATNQTFLYYIGSLKQTSIGYLIPTTHDKTWSFDTRKTFDKELFKISIELLYNMIKKNPDMQLLQATLADYYVKHKQAYIQASRFLLGNLKSSFSLQNTFYLGMIIILEKIKTLNPQPSVAQNLPNAPKCITLELKDYLLACKGFHQIKNNVEKQLDLQLQYWKLFRSLETDFFTLVKLSQKIHRQAKDVHKIIKKSHNLLQNRVSSPSLLYSLYYCFLQNDLLNSYFYYLQYTKLESRKQSTQNIDAKAIKIDEKNLRINSLYFLLSTADKKFGTVLDCSGGLMKYLQIGKKTLLGHPLSIILPKGYGQWLHEYLQHFSLSSSVEASDKFLTIPLVIREKYVELFNFHITVTYLSNHGLCFYGLFERIDQENRLLLLKTNGEVLHYSENMEKDMAGLHIKEIKNICKVCPEMNNVITALSEADQNNAEIIITNAGDDDDVPDIPNLVQKHSSETATTPGTHKTIGHHHFNTAPKEADLVFFSASSQASANSHKDLESITYKAEIRKQVFNGVVLLEVKMNKIDATTLSPQTIKERSPGILKTFRFPPNSPEEVEFLGTLEDQKAIVDTLPTTTNNLRSMHSPLMRKKAPFKFDSEEYIGSAKIQSKQLEEIESISSMSETFDFDEKIIPPQSPSINPILLSPTSERNQLMFTTRNAPKESYRKASQENDQVEKDHNQQQSYKQNVNNIISTLSREYLENDLIIEGKDMTSISSTVEKQHKSVIRKLRSKQYSRSTKIYFITFLIYLVLLFCFLFWLNYYTSTTSKRIERFSDVVQNTYFRNYRTKLTVRDALYWQGVIQDYVVYDPETTKEAFASSFYSMLSYNDLLIASLEGIDDDLQLLFYEKNVRIYHQNIDGDFIETTVDSTPQAILKLADRGLKLLETESLDSTGENSFLGICAYFVQNGMNDLLIRTEDYIEAVKERLFQILSNSSNLIQLVYMLAISMIIAFMLVSLLFIFYLTSQFKKFVNILYTITPQQVTKIESNLSKSKQLMHEYCQELDLFTSFDSQNKPSRSSSNSNSPQRIAHKNSNHESFRAANNTLSMKKFLIFIYILFLGLFVCVGLQLGFASIYYTEASNKIVVMKQQQVSLIAALSALDTYGMFNVALEMIIMQNGASKIKNNPSVSELENAVHRLDNIQSFQNSLTDEKGDLPLYQQKILYNISCYNVDSSLNSWNGSTTASECIAISNGLTYTGLIKIFMQTESNIENFINDYQSSSKNSTVLIKMYQDLWNRLSSYASTGNVLILLSFAYSTNSFNTLVEDLGNRSVVLAWVAGAVCIALGAITWLFVIRRLSRIPFERKKMLALLPQKIIFNNFLLKKYVANLE